MLVAHSSPSPPPSSSSQLCELAIRKLYLPYDFYAARSLDTLGATSVCATVYVRGPT